jgi:hypothetical protein
MINNMKKLTPYLVVTAIVYLIFSFVPWQFDPSMWEQDARVGFVMSWIGCMVVTPMVITMIESTKD